MAVVEIVTNKITDWTSFHRESAQIFGFPNFYGHNMNAWIDCLTYLCDDDGMSRIKLGDDGTLQIHVNDFVQFSTHRRDVCAGFLEGVAHVNARYMSNGDIPRLVLILK